MAHPTERPRLFHHLRLTRQTTGERHPICPKRITGCSALQSFVFDPSPPRASLPACPPPTEAAPGPSVLSTSLLNTDCDELNPRVAICDTHPLAIGPTAIPTQKCVFETEPYMINNAPLRPFAMQLISELSASALPAAVSALDRQPLHYHL